MCFAPQRRALFPRHNVQKCSEHEFWLILGDGGEKAFANHLLLHRWRGSSQGGYGQLLSSTAAATSIGCRDCLRDRF
eukprot:s5859_g2.t1